MLFAARAHDQEIMQFVLVYFSPQKPLLLPLSKKPGHDIKLKQPATIAPYQAARQRSSQPDAPSAKRQRTTDEAGPSRRDPEPPSESEDIAAAELLVYLNGRSK